MSVEIVSQIIFNMSRHADEDAPLQEKKYSARRAGAENLQRGNRQLAPRNDSQVLVNRSPNDQWHCHVEDDIPHDAGDADDQRKPIRTEIAHQCSKITAHES